MKLVTRDILSERAERAWLGCFGEPVEYVELAPETESDRLHVVAAVYADDLRSMPEKGLMQASAEDRFIVAWHWCRLLRDIEAGRTESATRGHERRGWEGL